MASGPSSRPGSWPTSATSPGSPTATGSRPGPAPHPSTRPPGEQNRHRLSRAWNRRMNHVLHIAAIVQLRHDTPGRAYFLRKVAAGKTRMEALRCLKRRLSDVVYRRLVADARAADTGPGGHCGATLQSSAADLHPHIDTSDQPLPGPATPTLRPTPPHRKAATPR